MPNLGVRAYQDWRLLGSQAQHLVRSLGVAAPPPGGPLHAQAYCGEDDDNAAKLMREYRQRGQGESWVHVTVDPADSHVDKAKSDWLKARLSGDSAAAISAVFVFDSNDTALDDEPPVELLATLMAAQLKGVALPPDGLRIVRCKRLQRHHTCTLLAPLLAAIGPAALALLDGRVELDRDAWFEDVLAGRITGDGTPGQTPWRLRPMSPHGAVCAMVGLGGHQLVAMFVRRSAAATEDLLAAYERATSGVHCGPAVPWRQRLPWRYPAIVPAAVAAARERRRRRAHEQRMVAWGHAEWEGWVVVEVTAAAAADAMTAAVEAALAVARAVQARRQPGAVLGAASEVQPQLQYRVPTALRSPFHWFCSGLGHMFRRRRVDRLTVGDVLDDLATPASEAYTAPELAGLLARLEGEYRVVLGGGEVWLVEGSNLLGEEEEACWSW